MKRFGAYFAVFRLAFSLSYKADWRRAAVCTALMLSVPLSMPLLALALRQTTNAAVAGDALRAGIAAGFLAIFWVTVAVVINFNWMLYVELQDLNTVVFEGRVIGMLNGSRSLAHLEHPETADKLELLRQEGHGVVQAFAAVTFVIGGAIQLVLTLVLLVLVEPYLGLLPLFALPWLLVEYRCQQSLDRAKQRTASQGRGARHLLELMTTRGAAHELRIFRLAGDLRRRHDAQWRDINDDMLQTETRIAFVRSGARLLFGLAAAAGIYLATKSAVQGHSSLGDIAMILALSVGIAQHVPRTVEQVNNLQQSSKSAQRFYALDALIRSASPRSGDRPLPDRLRDGIRFEGVGFRYPGTDAAVLDQVDLTLPPGSVVALVGDNGAGKTTLVKLLCRFYDASDGRITLDGREIGEYEIDEWRARISTSFQDVQRYELIAQEAVGVGELALIGDTPHIVGAVDRAHAADVISTLPEGLASQLGSSYAEGVDLSGGQWQKLALARAMMRTNPLLLLLDEPTSSLDPQTEHALFERYAASARDQAQITGAITLLTSHRFSTVRMADLIIVLDHGHIIELGTHEQLISQGGTYAELYQLQASAYA